MSGGSFDYICYKIKDAARYAEDKEISELLYDLADLLHDEEWADSGDYSKDKYLNSLEIFKKKWFGSNREERLKNYVDDSIQKLRDELYELVGVDENE